MSALTVVSGTTVLYREGQRLHLCSICAEWKPWGNSSGWYGSYRELEDAAPILKWCSDACGGQLALRGHHAAAEAFATGTPADADDAVRARKR